MARIEWDQIGEKLFETGIDRGVLYVYDASNEIEGHYGPAVAWNGLTSITETPSGADSNKQYADNGIYANLRGVEEFGGTIEAFMAPDEFAECDGQKNVSGVRVGGQTRKTFGLCYRTLEGNDTEGLEHGYKLHLVYGATASPSDRTYETVNESPEAGSLSWEYDTVPVPITIDDVEKKTSLLTISTRDVTEAQMTALENVLYGTSGATGTTGTTGYLPLPDKVIEIITEAAG